MNQGELRKIIHGGDLIGGATYILQHGTADTKDYIIRDTPEAQDIINSYLQFLLNEEKYDKAASLLWGDDLFTTEPQSVRAIWDEMPKSCKLFFIGAGSLGKSFNIAIYMLLDWIRDPLMTCIKVISSTETHAKRNVFAHIKNLHTNSVIVLPGEIKEKSIQASKDDKQGIHLVAIPQGDEGKGRLRGFHPVPRGEAHPQFGNLSRVRVVLDEAEEIPSGVWEDVDNVLITVDEQRHVLIVGATNPKDRDSMMGSLCEPPDGWNSLNIDKDFRWKSKNNWDVIRLDGAKCENVVQRKIVFPGLLTWDGYRSYLALGDTSPKYYTMARGWFPDKGISGSVIPPDFVQKNRGNYLFVGKTTYCLAIDFAYEGGDACKLTVGRFGLVKGWTDLSQTYHGFPKMKYGLQVESQQNIQKTNDSTLMADQVMTAARNLHAPAQWICCDTTGNGALFVDMIKLKFRGINDDGEPLGVHFGEKSTEERLFDDSPFKASELYDGMVTELFFCMRHFLEFENIKFGPFVKMETLEPELTRRKFKLKGNLVRVESKKEYCARGFDSPDHADSLSLLVHLVRMRKEFITQLIARNPGEDDEERQSKNSDHGIVDQIKFLSFTD